MKDARLELDRYITNPFLTSAAGKRSRISAQLNFRDLFRNKHATERGSAPWVPSRFTDEDIVKSIQTRKITQNPNLNFVPNSPFWDTENELDPKQYEMFAGLGRFHRQDYDFDEGRALTRSRPQQQPDFDPQWIEAYNLSPTVKPDKRTKNPMPRMRNPDPNGYLMTMAEQKAENEVENNVSVAQLLENKKLNPTEERVGEDTVITEEKTPAPPTPA